MNIKKINNLLSSCFVTKRTALRFGASTNPQPSTRARGDGVRDVRSRSDESEGGARSGGFTLVEMLIVLSIIGILTSVMIASTTLSRGKARDTRRIADMKEIQLGLALYYDVNKIYPAGSDASALNILVTQKYLPTIPTDPAAGNVYEYMVTSGKYCIGVKLEGAIPNDSATCTSAASGSVANYKSAAP